MVRGVAWLGAALGVLFLAGPALGQSGKVDLRPKFKKGTELRYRMTERSTGTTSMSEEDGADAPGGKAPAKTTAPGVPKGAPKGKTPAPGGDDDSQIALTVDLRFKVIESTPEGGATVELIYDAIAIKSKSALGDTDFDSARPKGKDGDDPQAAMLRSIVGTTQTLTVDRDGNITEVKGGEGLLPGGLGGGTGGGMGDPASMLTSPGAVKQTWGPIFTGRKGKGEATVGEKWTTTDSLDLSPIGSMTITTESVLKGVRGREAEIDFHGRIEPGKETSRVGQGFQIRSASQTGRYLWDTEGGALRSLTMKQTMEAEGAVAGMKISTAQRSETAVMRLDGATRPAPATPALKPAKPGSR